MIAILGQIFLGARRFNEIQRNLEIPRAVLSSRLNTAKSFGLVEQRQDSYDGRPRFFLTEKGRGLWTLLTVVMRWADDFMVGGSGMRLIHAGCGEDSQAVMVCTVCGERLVPDDLIPVAAHSAGSTR
jgi:DNA-binding HxlR family transcriptional regulator